MIFTWTSARSWSALAASSSAVTFSQPTREEMYCSLCSIHNFFEVEFPFDDNCPSVDFRFLLPSVLLFVQRDSAGFCCTVFAEDKLLPAASGSESQRGSFLIDADRRHSMVVGAVAVSSGRAAPFCWFWGTFGEALDDSSSLVFSAESTFFPFPAAPSIACILFKLQTNVLFRE